MNDDTLTQTTCDLKDLSFTDQFDAAIRRVTQDRGKIYGSPLTDFTRCAKGESVISECNDPEIRHVLNMIWTKVCRLIESPDHQDSWEDIAGYVRTACMLRDERLNQDQGQLDLPLKKLETAEAMTRRLIKESEPISEKLIGKKIEPTLDNGKYIGLTHGENLQKAMGNLGGDGRSKPTKKPVTKCKAVFEDEKFGKGD